MQPTAHGMEDETQPTAVHAAQAAVHAADLAPLSAGHVRVEPRPLQRPSSLGPSSAPRPGAEGHVPGAEAPRDAPIRASHGSPPRRPAGPSVRQEFPEPRVRSRQGVACMDVNVGGTIFKAGVATLGKSKFLAPILGDELSDDMKDDQGRLYIDRDPALFREVLRLLRGYPARLSADSQFSWNDLKAEADFFQVPLEMLNAPVEVAVPPDILSVRRVYAEDPESITDPLHRGEMGMYSMSDLPPDLKSATRIIAVEVMRGCGAKTVFAVGQRTLEEAGFAESIGGVWERTERYCYHRIRPDCELVIPKHPMEISRAVHEHFVCVTYCIPPMGNIVCAGGSVVGVLNTRRVRGYD